MENMINNLENQLKELSYSFISFFEKLKENNIITQEEFEMHTAKKRSFLNSINNTNDQ